LLIIDSRRDGTKNRFERLLSDRAGITVADALISLCIIGILAGIFIAKLERVTREARDTALRSELSNLRTSIMLFKLMNGRYPANLLELREKKVLLPARVGADRYTWSVIDERYLMAHAVDNRGNVLDPFGYPFAYDPRTGNVKATTSGYETW
jgi:type II secretory pathway pseudopilin PulG